VFNSLEKKLQLAVIFATGLSPVIKNSVSQPFELQVPVKTGFFAVTNKENYIIIYFFSKIIAG